MNWYPSSVRYFAWRLAVKAYLKQPGRGASEILHPKPLKQLDPKPRINPQTLNTPTEALKKPSRNPAAFCPWAWPLV